MLWFYAFIADTLDNNKTFYVLRRNHKISDWFQAFDWKLLMNVWMCFSYLIKFENKSWKLKKYKFKLIEIHFKFLRIDLRIQGRFLNYLKFRLGVLKRYWEPRQLYDGWKKNNFMQKHWRMLKTLLHFFVLIFQVL